MEDFDNGELINKILKFKESLDEKLKYEYEEKLKNISENENVDSIKNAEVENIIYYKRFSLKTKFKDLLLNLQDIYIVEINDNGNIICEMYLKDVNRKIAEIDIEGKITFFDERLEDNTKLSEIIENNSDKEIYEMKELNKEELEELKQEKAKKDLEEEKKPEELNEKNEVNEEEKEKDLFEDTEKSTEQLEEDLQLDKGDIRSCTKIKLTGKDNVFRRQVPECKEFDEVLLVYISSQDCFRFVGLKRGKKPKFLESIEPSQGTMKKSMDIDAEDGKVEQQNIHRLMKFTDSKDYDFSVKIGQYGYIELSTLRKDPVTNKYISTKVETTTQRPREKQKEVNELMDKNKNLRINEEIDRFEEKKKEEGKDAKVNLNDISDKSAEKKEELEKETENERTLDENVRKYYY